MHSCWSIREHCPETNNTLCLVSYSKTTISVSAHPEKREESCIVRTNIVIRVLKIWLSAVKDIFAHILVQFAFSFLYKAKVMQSFSFSASLPKRTRAEIHLKQMKNLLLLAVSEMKIQLQLKVHFTQHFLHLKDIGIVVNRQVTLLACSFIGRHLILSVNYDCHFCSFVLLRHY